MKNLLLSASFTFASLFSFSQNVGIGTSSPATKLHINAGVLGLGRQDGGDLDPYFQLGLTDFYDQYIGNNATFNSTTDQWNYVRTGGYGGLASAIVQSNGIIRFSTASGGVNPMTLNERVRVSNDGNVGINTTIPQSRLNVNGGLALGNPGGSGPINSTWGAGNSIQMATAFGSECNDHSGVLMYTNMPCAWGAATLNIAISNNWASYNTTNMALRIGQNLSTFNQDVQANGIVYWGNGLARTETRDNAGLRGDAGARSGFFETSSPTNFYTGASSWQHLIDVRHSNNGNNYALQIAGSFFDQRLWFRKTNNDPTQPWSEIQTFGSSNPSNIAFFAYKNASQFQGHNTWAEQNFAVTTFNDGGAYSTATGNFTVPAGQGGVYSFQATIFSYDWTDRNPRGIVSIYVNGIETARLDDQNFRDMFKHQSINGAVTLKLNAGDVVDVRTYYTRSDGNGVTWNTEGAYMSFFSGHRVY